MFLFTQPAVWAWETWYSVVWASQSLASAKTSSSCDTSPTVECCSLSLCRTQSQEEEEWTWKCWRTFAVDELTVVRRHWLFFFWCLREEGEDSERGETKFSAGVTVKFTAPTTMHAEEKQPECSQRHSKCEQEHEEAGSFRLNAHRTVQTRPVWSRSVHDGIFPDVYFYTQPLGRPHERRPMASRREQVSALFFVAWTQRPLTESFPWATEGANPLKETPTFKKRIFWRPAPGSLPAGLKNCF